MRSACVELDLLSSAAVSWSSIASSSSLGLEVAKHLLFANDITEIVIPSPAEPRDTLPLVQCDCTKDLHFQLVDHVFVLYSGRIRKVKVQLFLD